MSTCPSDLELAELERATADDPRREHVAACPRCRARLADHAAFVRGAHEVPPAERAAAERALAAAIAAKLDAMGTPPAGARATVTPLPARMRRRVAWPMWAAAAAFAIAAGWLAVRGTGPSLERGTRVVTPARDRVAVLAPRVAEGAITLRWEGAIGADRYVVRFVGADLVEVARSPELAATEYVLRRDALPAGLVSGRPVLWQVVAFDSGTRVAASEPATLRVP